MALIAHPSNGYDVTLVFNGALDATTPVTVTSDDPTIARASLTSYNAATFTAVVAIEHGGVAGTTSVRILGDGDLGAGVTGIEWADTFEALAASATTVVATVSSERPSPVVTP